MAAFSSPLALVQRSAGKFKTIDTSSPEASGINRVGLYQLKLTEMHTGTSDQLSVFNAAASEIVRFEAGGLRVLGDLIVEGERNVVKSTDVMVEDNYLLLNHSYVTASTQPGGLVVNYLPTSTSDSTSGTGVFTAGNSSTSPQVTTAGSAFSAADIIQISASASNDGLYEVLTHSGGVLKIKGTKSGVDAVEAFTQIQFAAHSGDTGAAIRKVTVSVLRAGADGKWEVASGAATGLSYTDLMLSSDASDTGTTNVSYSINSDAGAADEDASLILKSSDGSSSNVDVGTLQYIFGADGSDLGTWKASADVWLAKAGGSTSDPDLEVDGYARFDGTVEFDAAILVDAGATIVAGLTVTSGGIDLNGGGFDLAAGGITNAGAVSGVTTLAIAGALTGVTTLAASSTATFSGPVDFAGASAVVSAGYARLNDGIQLRIGSDDDGLAYYDAGQGKVYLKGAARSTAGQAGVQCEVSAGAGGVGAGSTAGGGGGALYFQAANGGGGAPSDSGGAASGGLINVTAGAGGAANVSGTSTSPSSGGAISITSGGGGAGNNVCVGGAAGSLSLRGGAGGAGADTSSTDTAGGAGGAVSLEGGGGGTGFGSADGPAGGSVTVDAGSGGQALGAGDDGAAGSISIGANTASALAIGRAAVTTTVAGTVSLSLAGGSTGSPDFAVAGYAKFAQAAEFDAAAQFDAGVTITASGLNLSASGLTNAGAVSGVTTLAGNSTISGFTSLALSAALTGVTTIAMNGGLSGCTTFAASGLVDLDGAVRHSRVVDFYLDGFTASGVGTGLAVYVSGDGALSAATNASGGKGDLMAGVWNGSGLVPAGKLVTVAKSTGETWGVGQEVYLGADSKATSTLPTTAGLWQKVLGYYQGAASNSGATGRILLTLEPAVQNL